MADFFTGLSYGDQLEAGLATHGAADPEVWNAMLRKDADEARLAQQVRQFGEGHGQEPLATQQGDGAQPAPFAWLEGATVTRVAALQPRLQPKPKPGAGAHGVTPGGRSASALKAMSFP